MQYFDIFYYLNRRFPYTNGLLWASDGNKLNLISGEKISLKRLYELFRGTCLHRLVWIQFLAALNLFLKGKEKILKDASTKVYNNLLLLDLNLSLTESGIMLTLAIEINFRLENSIFAKKKVECKN